MRAVRSSVRWTALIGVSPGVMLESVHATCGSLQTARTVLTNCRSSVTWTHRTPVAPGVSVASVKLPVRSCPQVVPRKFWIVPTHA